VLLAHRFSLLYRSGTFSIGALKLLPPGRYSGILFQGYNQKAVWRSLAMEEICAPPAENFPHD
jgi:hypothetical protein